MIMSKEMKDAIKEALKDWMDDKFTQLGKWSLGVIVAAVLVAIVYFILWSNGWHQETVITDQKKFIDNLK